MRDALAILWPFLPYTPYMGPAPVSTITVCATIDNRAAAQSTLVHRVAYPGGVLFPIDWFLFLRHQIFSVA
jgi:hypothetical protein